MSSCCCCARLASLVALVLGQSIPVTVASHVARNSCLGCSAKIDKQNMVARRISVNDFFMVKMFCCLKAQFGDKISVFFWNTQTI